MSVAYIYTLCHPQTLDVRYVGVTRFPEDRQRSHCRPEATLKGRWVQSLAKQGLRPKLVVIEEIDESVWQEREQHWIAEYKRRGVRLTNGDDGGLNRLRHTDELKQKISQTLMGRSNVALAKQVYAYDGAGGVFWSYLDVDVFLPDNYLDGKYQATKSAREKLSAFHKGRWVGRTFSPETIEKMRASALARVRPVKIKDAIAKGERVTIEIV
jgi:NUMOD3 motif